MLYFEKSVLYSTRTRQYFCTVSHQSSRIGSALLLYQTFINRGKATPHGPTDVYKLKWLRVLESKAGIFSLHLKTVTVTCCAVLRTLFIFNSFTLANGILKFYVTNLSVEKGYQAQRLSKKLKRLTINSQHPGLERGLLYRGQLFYFPFLDFFGILFIIWKN